MVKDSHKRMGHNEQNHERGIDWFTDTLFTKNYQRKSVSPFTYTRPRNKTSVDIGVLNLLLNRAYSLSSLLFYLLIYLLIFYLLLYNDILDDKDTPFVSSRSNQGRKPLT